MKAVKITKILWELDDLSPEEKGKVKASLPTSKGFLAGDEFEVTERVPGILKKKYGYDVANFSYTEVHICESLDALLRVFGPKKKDDTPIKLFKDGKMTEEGQLCYDNLIAAIKERKKMEFRGTSDEEMPKILDKLMFSLEKITGLDWKENSEDEIKKEIDDLIEDELKKFIKSKEAIKIMRKEARKSLKAEMKKMDDEGDSDFDEEDA
jgi:hypothetical protein